MSEERGPERLELIGAFESTFQPHHDTDVAESTHHIHRRSDDLDLLRGCGVHRVRYPIRWHRAEVEPGRFDWSEADEVMEHLAEFGWRPILDLVHHTSYPAWLTGGFADERFPEAYLRYVEAFGARYPGVQEYTVFNEPFSTLLLCGGEGVWPPYGRGMESFTAMLRNVLPAIGDAARLAQQMWPSARHLTCDSCERHTGEGENGGPYAEYANDRRFFVLDALMGLVSPSDASWRPFVGDLVRNGGADLLELEPMPVHEVGLDYYAHCQWHFTDVGGVVPTPYPAPLSDLAAEYASRYDRPVWIGETNLRGFATDRISWMKHTLEQTEIAMANGVDVRGFCWFPFIDSCDWSSLLLHNTGAIDPVGAVSIDEVGDRVWTVMSDVYREVGRGASSADITPYRFAEPVASWLAGWMRMMKHWSWKQPPAEWVSGYTPGDDVYEPLARPA